MSLSYTYLQTIHKLQILLIRQVQKLLILNLPVARLLSLAFLDLVLSRAPEVDEQGVEETEGVADDDGDFSGDIPWGVGGAESLWTDYVAGTCGVRCQY